VARPTPPTSAKGGQGGLVGCLLIPFLVLLLLGGGIVVFIWILVHRIMAPDPAPSTSASIAPPVVSSSPSPVTPSSTTKQTTSATTIGPPPNVAPRTTAPIVTTTPSVVAAPKLTFEYRHQKWGGLNPNASKFIDVANANGPSLKTCFDGLKEEFSVTVRVTFTADGGRGPKLTILHHDDSGWVPAAPADAEHFRNCMLTPIAMWSWPSVTKENVEEMKQLGGGLPFEEFNVSLIKR